MITNKDIRVENGNLVLNGDKFPLDGQSPEAIMEIVEDNSDSTPTENSTAPVTSGGVYTAVSGLSKAIASTTGGKISRGVKTIANNESVEIQFANDFSSNTEFALVALNIDGNALGGMALLVLGIGTGKVKDLIGSMPTTNYEATFSSGKWTIKNKSGSTIFVTAMMSKGLLT